MHCGDDTVAVRNLRHVLSRTPRPERVDLKVRPLMSKFFESIRIPARSLWFWIGFLGTLALILLAAMFWLALHRPA